MRQIVPQMLNFRAGLSEKPATPDLSDLVPSLISFRLPRGASFFRLKPALQAFECVQLT
jgi:hypothetical protein